MIDNQTKNTTIYNEFDLNNNSNFFDYCTKNFIHTIDTFYYSIKLAQDFTKDTDDFKVLNFRKYSDNLKTIYKNIFEPVQVNIPGLENIYYTYSVYDQYYNFHLNYPDMFDIYFATHVPYASSGVGSVTPEILVQLRSYNLWMHGVYFAIEESLKIIKQLLKYFKLDIFKVIENRVDYCWHTNYISNPAQFFDLKNFYEMKVSRYKGCFMHTSNLGTSDYELDYIAMGKRGSKCFTRIYLKSKEVVQMGYKPYFFKAWLFKKLINRFDFYCLEYAFQESSWKALDIGRLKFYLEYGSNELLKRQCKNYIDDWNLNRSISDSVTKLANELTPKVHNIINVEFQTMRKQSKSFVLQDWKRKTSWGDLSGPRDVLLSSPCKDLLIYLKNLKLIREYLTTDILRLVEKNGDANKSRRPDTNFWSRLRSTKSDYDLFNIDEQKLLREYQHNKSIDRLKRDTIHKAVTLGLYLNGKNDNSPLQDAFQSLLVYNDNDIENAKKYKEKKIKELNLEQSLNLQINNRNISILDNDTGVVYDYNTLNDLLNQEDNENIDF